VRILLDTHAFLWWLFDDPKLSQSARECIRKRGNTIFVSAASAWEISTKHRLGKLPEASVVVTQFSRLLKRAGMEALDVSVEHALLAGTLAIAHCDPFDRMLAAQSRLENLPLLTRDPALAMFDIDLLW